MKTRGTRWACVELSQGPELVKCSRSKFLSAVSCDMKQFKDYMTFFQKMIIVPQVWRAFPQRHPHLGWVQPSLSWMPSFSICSSLRMQNSKYPLNGWETLYQWPSLPSGSQKKRQNLCFLYRFCSWSLH